MRHALVLAMIAATAAPALAQTQRLPRTSPAERQVLDLNQSLQQQNRSLNAQQQSQFEVNQLRQELNRQRALPPITSPGRICAPGELNC